MQMSWREPAEDLAISSGQVHVWRIWLDLSKATVQGLFAELSDTEKEKVSSFHKEVDSRRYAAAHAGTREILSKYLNLPPAEIEFTNNPYGKPEINSKKNSLTLCFNLTHSNAVAILAVSVDTPLGVDIEKITRNVDVAALAQRFFSPGEIKYLLNLPDEEQKAAFFRCWTRKEAYIKALGMGLSIPLDQFEVSLDLDGPVQINQGISQADYFSLYHLEPFDNYVGALSVKGHPLALDFFSHFGW